MKLIHILACSASAALFLFMRPGTATALDNRQLMNRLTELQRQWHEPGSKKDLIHRRAEGVRVQLCEGGVTDFCPKKSRTMRICEAIAWQETKSCTLGVGASKNNCVGIRRNSAYVVYDKPKDSLVDCVDVWDRLYGGKEPTLKLAETWSSPGAAAEWLKNVQWHLENRP